MTTTTYRFGAFISYASEDRTAVAAPLVAALKEEKVAVWFDQNELLIGQQVHGRIKEGLRESRFVIAVLSPDYLRKDWPQLELAAAPGRVIPVLHGITREQLKAIDPLIAQVKSLTWDDNERAVVEAILDRIRNQPRTVRSDVAVVLAHNQTDWDDLETAIDERLPNVTKLTHGFFDDAELLAASRVLIMPPPREYRLTRWEIDQVEKWVQSGGGLLLMGHYAERHHEMNVGEVAWRFNLEFGDDVLMPPSRLDRGHARSVKPHYAVGAVPSAGDHPIAAGVRDTAWISSASVHSTVMEEPDFALVTCTDTVVMRQLGKIEATGFRPQFDDQVEDRRGPVPVLAARTLRRGRVVVAGTWKLWTVAQRDNAQLITNILTWLRGA